MTAVSRTPRATWKANEAQFSLGHLRQAATPRDPAEGFLFYLSAFLNAAYSCRQVLRLEAIQGNLLSRDAWWCPVQCGKSSTQLPVVSA